MIAIEPIRVLVVDDSAFMRHAVTRLLGESPGIEVVGAAANGEAGLELARQLRPDVITLDVEMPVLDGLGMLHRVMAEQPARVIMLSSLTTDGAAVTMDALASGAIDFVAKPSGSLSIDIGRVGLDLVAKIQAAASMSQASFLVHARRAAMRVDHGSAAMLPRGAAPGGMPDARQARDAGKPRPPRTVARKIVVIASSTGGPSALQAVVGGLPERLGGAVLIVQHMPAGFTSSLARRLDSSGRLEVVEAAADDLISDERILVAPGDYHLVSSASGRIQLVRLPPVNGVRPAADVTLQSLAPVWRDRMLSVVLTGMGSDGTEGARAVRKHGGAVFAQDEATATIYGMPRAVVEAGLADRVLPLDRMADAIAAWADPAVH
ncbi:MAG: chemotaxis response regulator protein-glutamate methylesterase [Anaerolinea sp.]|nr:chemotaxis response regulator protein-glutamate methylesterase [Anaerolinea sp.]